jgi:hypothetical protein
MALWTKIAEKEEELKNEKSHYNYQFLVEAILTHHQNNI